MSLATPSVSEATPGADSKQSRLGSVLVVAGVVAAAFVPLGLTHLVQLWVRPHYQFFPLVFVGAGVLAYMRFPGRAAALQAGQPGLSLALVASAWLLLAIAEVLHSSFLAAVSALLLVLAVIYTAGGSTLVRRMLPAWLYLGLLLPLPFGLDQVLVLALQRLTTAWSSALLDQLGVFHMIAGNVVEIGPRRLFVAEACAGINSLFSILACALFYVLFTGAGFWRGALLLLASVCWVLLANVVRVFLIAYLARSWSIDAAEGWRHEALGYLLFAAALGLIWSSDRLLTLLTPQRWKQKSVAPAAETVPAEPCDLTRILRQSWLYSWLTAAAFGLLLAAHLVLYTWSADAAPVLAGPTHLDCMSKDTLSANLDGWPFERDGEEQRDSSNAFGEYSKTWYFRTDFAAAVFSLDYPFGEWHELQECYRNQGWEVEAKADHAAAHEGAPPHYSERRLKKNGLRFAQLFFCQFDQAGQPVPPAVGGLTATLRRHESALGRWFAGNQDAAVSHRPVGAVYQFQLLVESDAPLDAAKMQTARTHFFKAYQKVRGQLLD